MMQRNYLWIVIALGSVLGSFIAGPQLATLQIPVHQDHATGSEGSQVAEAATLPLAIDWHYKIKDKVGDAAAGSNVKIDDQYIDAEIHCEICTKIEITPGPQGRAGLAYAFDKIQDLSAAKSVTFFIMGEDGGEKVKVKVGGKSKAASDTISEKPARGNDKRAGTGAGNALGPGLFKQEFAATTEEVVATKDWKKFAVDVEGLDLKSVSHPFGLEFEGKKGSQTQVIIIKHITYDTEPAVNPLAASNETVSLANQTLSVDVIANATNATAPASMAFAANVTGGQPPYSLQWDFGNGDQIETEQDTNGTDGGQAQMATFDEPGSYNVTVDVADSSNQTGSASTEVQITGQDENLGKIPLSIEANATESVAPAAIEFEASAGDDDLEDLAVEWEFGDGESGQGQSVTHVFSEPGEYNVTANATGSDTQTGSDWIAIEVSEGTPQNTSQDSELEGGSANESDDSNEIEDTAATTNDSSDNTAPDIDAIEQILAYPGDDVILDASGTTDKEDDPITFNWLQSSGPEVEIDNEDTATPRITIPDDIEQDEEVVMEVTATDASLSSQAHTVTVAIDHVQAFVDSQEDSTLDESVLAPESLESASEWETDCEEIADCLGDEESDTMVAAGPDSSTDSELLLSFEELEATEEEAEIRFIELRLDASKSNDAGYLTFILEDEGDEPYTSDPVSIVAESGEFGEYRLLLEEDPRSGQEWTVESVNDLVAGISFGGGLSEVQVSEVALVVTYESLTVEEPSEGQAEPGSESEEEPASEDNSAEEELSEEEQSAPEEDPTAVESESQDSVEDPSTNSTESE